MAAVKSASSRKATCCVHGTPTITRRPASCASSRSQIGGGVYTRTVLNPAEAIAAKS
jgi:hypothetical protein